MDDWNDSILSVKLAIAQGLLPAISGGIEAGSTWVQTVHAATQALGEHQLSLLDYVKLSAQVVWTDKSMADALDEINTATGKLLPTESDHGEKLSNVETKTYDVDRATQAATDR